MSKRLRAALVASGAHLLLSLLVASIAAWLVFFQWYPEPFDDLSGGNQLFEILIGVDVACGALLTLVLYNPEKSTRELCIDIGLVVLIQLTALVYGMNAVAQARPLAVVYEIDRFRAISLADVFEEELDRIPDNVRVWSFQGPTLWGLRLSADPAELLKSMDMSMAGIQPSQRPTRWQELSKSTPAILARSKSIDDLIALHPEQRQLIADRITHTGSSSNELRWLPLVSRRSSNWVMIFSATDPHPIAYIPLNGFPP